VAETILPSSRATIGGAMLVALVAFAARLMPIFAVPGINHPDEIFQSLEPAHLLVFGYGLDTWTGGLRSAILPGIIAALMEASRLFGSGPDIYIPVVQTAFAALSATGVACCFLWAARRFGLWPAIAAASVPAFWPDALYFGGRTLSEPVAASLLVIALYLLEPGYLVTSRRRLAWGGALLTLAFVIRIQLGPAIAVAAIWAWLRAPRRRLLPLFGGVLGMLVLNGLLDAATAGYPFAPEWRNLTANLANDVASSFGTAPWNFFLLALWGAATLPLAALTLLGARQAPLLLTSAVVILLAHSVIPHKEYRFVYPAILLLLIVAGLGLAQLVAWFSLLSKPLSLPAGYLLSIGALGIVLIVALSCATIIISPRQQALWRKGEDMMRASALIARLPSVCGIGTFGIYWWDTGGYTFFHRNVPFYWPLSPAQFAHDAPGFDTLIETRGAPRPPDYDRRQCFGSICIAQRPGGCQPVPMTPLPPAGAGNVLRHYK
jgi:hypothetical protein